MKIFKIDDKIVFVHGTNVVKGIINEVFVHTKKDEIIVKYVIRPYGLGETVTIDAENVYSTFDKAKKIAIETIKKTYKKSLIKKAYLRNKKKMKDDYDNQMNNFDENMKKVEQAISNASEDFFEKLEEEYLNNLKEEKK